MWRGARRISRREFAGQARSVELTIEMSAILRGYGIRHAALLVKVDTRKQRFADEARDTLEGFGLEVLGGSIPLLAAFDKGEVQGVTVREAVDDKGRSDPRRMIVNHARHHEFVRLVPVDDR